MKKKKKQDHWFPKWLNKSTESVKIVITPNAERRKQGFKAQKINLNKDQIASIVWSVQEMRETKASCKKRFSLIPIKMPGPIMYLTIGFDKTQFDAGI